MNVKAAAPGRRALLVSAGAVGTALGGLALIGWWFHIPALTRAGASYSPMVANTAFGFVADGMALLLIAGGRPRGAWVGAAWSLLAGVLTLAEYALSVDLGRRPSSACWVRSYWRSGHPRFWAMWQVSHLCVG